MGLRTIADAIAQADYLMALELLEEFTEEERAKLGPIDSLRADYFRCLALARGGSAKGARRALQTLRAASTPIELPVDLDEDLASLEARLAKDEAFRRVGVDRRAFALEAAELYEAVYRRLHRPYACINAATMLTVAGGETEIERSKVLAREALELSGAFSQDASPEGSSSEESETNRYWRAVTRAEAFAVLRDQTSMQAEIEIAAPLAPLDLSARASTVRQLQALFGVVGFEPSLLQILRNPPVLHYCGHRVSTEETTGRLPQSSLPLVEAEIVDFFGASAFSAAYGSLASGADITFAEMCVRHGIDLHVVLPFEIAEFEKVSVADSGGDWVDRFRACLDAATSVEIACDSEYFGDDVLFGHAAKVAMGEARNRAHLLATEAVQVAVWDGIDAPADAGTAHDVNVWRIAGGSTRIIDSAGTGVSGAEVGAGDLSRQILPVVFGDLKGYSRLGDRDIRAFQAKVMTPLAAVLRKAGDGVLVAQTWGDGLKVVFSDVATAAVIALEIQSTLREVDLEAAGLPADLGLRLSGHVGPLLPILDAVSGEGDYAGREMTRAARIEPRTPEGEVYVTGAFAALLALDPTTDVTPEYVGTITTARDFETIPVYVLTR